MKTQNILLLTALFLIWFTGPINALEVKLTVSEPAQADRNPGVITVGVPFAKGIVKDISKLSVSSGGKQLPAQFIKLSPWDDGSVRWALMDTQIQVAAGGKAELLIKDDGSSKAPDTPVKITENDREVKVSTGPLEFIIDNSEIIKTEK